MKSILLQETVFFQASCIHMELLLNVIKDTRNYRFWRESSLVLSLLFCTINPSSEQTAPGLKQQRPTEGSRLQDAWSERPDTHLNPPLLLLPLLPLLLFLLSLQLHLCFPDGGGKKKRKEESTEGSREIKRQRDKRGTRPMRDRKRCWLRGRERGTDGEWDKERRSGDV